MKTIFLFAVISLFLFTPISQPVKGLTEPVPQLSTIISYPDTCNPEFWATFEITNLGESAHSDSYLSITLSRNLDLLSWYATPRVPDMMIRIYEIGDTVQNMSGSLITTKNKIIQVYNHSFNNNESITITIFFENSLYQATDEWIKCRMVMYPENADVSSTLMVQDPAQSTRKDQQGHPVYQLAVAPNNKIYPIDSENIEVIPEFPSWIIVPFLVITTSAAIIVKRKLNKQQ